MLLLLLLLLLLQQRVLPLDPFLLWLHLGMVLLLRRHQRSSGLSMLRMLLQLPLHLSTLFLLLLLLPCCHTDTS